VTPERQVLYGLVSAAFHLVVLVLIVAARSLVPGWWSWLIGFAWSVVTVTGIITWRRTARLLAMTIGLFLTWTVGTIIVL
jgi:hypothetical protein